MKKPEKFTLCTAGSCCPVVEITEDTITISDDYNGKVTLTRDEAIMFAKKMMELK